MAMTITKTIELKKTSRPENAGSNVRDGLEYSVADGLNTLREEEVRSDFAESERELLGEVARAVRSIKYGSIVLTIHEGRLVEISKTIRLRKNLPGRKE